ncbi:HU family DNA-binding protein [Coxiella-like endosymbiont]|uniref:HU family DNA-binding protein n=1 Tax=Coxiella-like endosymbiont TaxID=1592897 RepID=UPI0027299296|nr:HU family DNA-binding protein [Coxiella-like endosymbiont]
MPSKKKTSQIQLTKKKEKSLTSKIMAVKERMMKLQVLTHLSEKIELIKKQVSKVFEALADLTHGHLKKGGIGKFVISGLAKCTIKRKPASKARHSINPFTGEAMTSKSKPDRNIVKIRPLKQLLNNLNK